MASFRTNVVLDSNQIIIGSNGNNFMDRNLHDHESGVYLLNRKTGRIEQHVAGEKYGDMDVNGVLLYHGRLFFGNDNEEFLCTDKKGLVIWRNPTSGDIEHEPSLLDIRGKKRWYMLLKQGK